MSGDTYYQSPILLHHCCSCNITINEPVGIRGINYGAVYDASKHIFVVKDKIIIKFNSNKYQLEEYHFSPVRWLVGDEPIRLNIEEISHFAKDARPIQESDGRIILFSDKIFY